MNFETKDILTLVVMAAGLIGTWFRNHYKIERLIERDREQDARLTELGNENRRHIEYLRVWKHDHEKESNAVREQIAKDLADLRSAVAVTNEQFRQIMETLAEIKDRLTRLEDR